MSIFSKPKPQPNVDFAVRSFQGSDEIELSDLTSRPVAKKQAEAAALYELLSEARQAADSVANMASTVPLVAEGDPALRLVDSIEANLSVREFTRLAVAGLYVLGEFWLVSEGNTLHYYPPSAISRKNGRIVVSTPKGDRTLAADETARRVFRPDPLNPSQPTSSLFAVVDEGKTLLCLSRLVRSVGTSRSIAGLLLFPSEAIAPTDDEDEETVADSVFKALSEPIEHKPGDGNLGSSPVLIEMSEQYLDKVKHLTLDRSIEESINALIATLSQRIATTLEIPTSSILTSGTNHIQSYDDSQRLVRFVVEPFLSLVEDTLNRYFLDGRARVNYDVNKLREPFSKAALYLDLFRIGAVKAELLTDHFGIDPKYIDNRRPASTTPNIPRRAEGRDGTSPEDRRVTDERP